MTCDDYQWDGAWAGIDNDKVTSKPKCKHCKHTYQEHMKKKEYFRFIDVIVDAPLERIELKKHYDEVHK